MTAYGCRLKRCIEAKRQRTEPRQFYTTCFFTFPHKPTSFCSQLVSSRHCRPILSTQTDPQTNQRRCGVCFMQMVFFCITQRAFEHYSRYPSSRIIYRSVTSLSSALSLRCENHFGTRIMMGVFIQLFIFFMETIICENGHSLRQY